MSAPTADDALIAAQAKRLTNREYVTRQKRKYRARKRALAPN